MATASLLLLEMAAAPHRSFRPLAKMMDEDQGLSETAANDPHMLRDRLVHLAGRLGSCFVLASIGAFAYHDHYWTSGLGFVWDSFLQFFRRDSHVAEQSTVLPPARWLLAASRRGAQARPNLPSSDASLKRFAQLVGGAAKPGEVEARLSLLQGKLKYTRLRASGLDYMSFNLSARRLNDVTRTTRHHRAQELNREMSISQCFGAVYDMANYIGWAGLNVDALVHSCPNADKNHNAYITCSSNAVDFVQAIGWVLTNAAQIPDWCIPNFKGHNANKCFVSMAFFATSSEEIAADGMAMEGDCQYLWAGHELGDAVRQGYGISGGRRLRSKSSVGVLPLSPLPPNPVDRLAAHVAEIADDRRNYNLGVCSMAAMQLANDLAYTGIDMWATVQDCTSKDEDPSVDNIENCAGDILGIFADFPEVASDLAKIIASCPMPNDVPKEAACVADTADLVSSVLGLAAWAATVSHACGELDNQTGQLPLIAGKIR